MIPDGSPGPPDQPAGVPGRSLICSVVILGLAIKAIVSAIGRGGTGSRKPLAARAFTERATGPVISATGSRHGTGGASCAGEGLGPPPFTPAWVMPLRAAHGGVVMCAGDLLQPVQAWHLADSQVM